MIFSCFCAILRGTSFADRTRTGQFDPEPYLPASPTNEYTFLGRTRNNTNCGIANHSYELNLEVMERNTFRCFAKAPTALTHPWSYLLLYTFTPCNRTPEVVTTTDYLKPHLEEQIQVQVPINFIDVHCTLEVKITYHCQAAKFVLNCIGIATQQGNIIGILEIKNSVYWWHRLINPKENSVVHPLWNSLKETETQGTLAVLHWRWRRIAEANINPQINLRYDGMTACN